MNVKLDMNTLNCVLLVVVLSLVIMCCMKSNNENFESQEEQKYRRFLQESFKKCETERGLYNPKPTPTQNYRSELETRCQCCRLLGLKKCEGVGTECSLHNPKPTPTPYYEDTPMTYRVVNKTERYPKPTPTPYYEDTPMTYRVVNKTERYPKPTPTEHPKCDYYCSNPINGFEKGSDEAKAARCVKQSRDNQCGKCNFCVEMKKDR